MDDKYTYDTNYHLPVKTKEGSFHHSGRSLAVIPTTTATVPATIKINITTLRAIASNEKELSNFMATHFQHLDRRQIQQVSRKIQHLVELYQKMKHELVYIKDNLPPLIKELENIKGKIDGVHKTSQFTSISTRIGAIVGGLCTIVGFVAAPFTGGTSIPAALGVAGIVVGAASGGAHIANKMITSNRCAAYRDIADRLAEDMNTHYETARDTYEELKESCEGLATELCSLCPELHRKYSNDSMLSFVWSVCGLVYKPPKAIYSATDIIRAPLKHGEEKKQIALGFAKIISEITKGNLKGLINDVALPSFQSLMTVIKSVSHIGAAVSVAIDAYNALMEAKKIAKKHKNQASRDVEDKIKTLKEIEAKMEVLRQQIELDD
ncbi:uncharacterized protein [Dysidea avara]|uniref:uncharacterized protein n=1 Tax=Dysidea avara TaxID=196820 RepID=UPI00331916E5